MVVKIYRAIGYKKPSYLDKNCDYIAYSENHGERITFYPVRNHPKSAQHLIALRERFNNFKK
jgi:hypothetical protein